MIVPIFPKLSESFIVSKFVALLERGWDVYVVCAVSDRAAWRHFQKLEGFPNARKRVITNWTHRPRWLAGLLIPVALFLSFWRNPAGAWRYLRRGAKRFGWGVWRRSYLDASILGLAPDLVHFEFGTLAVDQMHMGDLLDCKIITSFRGFDMNYVGLDDPNYFREIWEQSDALHLLGEDLWRRALRRGCPPSKTHALIAPAVDSEFFKSANRVSSNHDGSSSRPVRILSVGRLEWIKGYEYAIGAVRLLLNQGLHVEYRIAGQGQYLESLSFERHQLGMQGEVQFLGALPQAHVREELFAADIFLHAAVSEGFCNAVVEAQAMGLPVVCSDAGGLPENVADGETGFVVPRRSAQALADKLAVLARDPALRLQMGQAGRKRVLERFQLAGQSQAFDQFYRRVLSAGPPAAITQPGGQAMTDPLPTAPGGK